LALQRFIFEEEMKFAVWLQEAQPFMQGTLALEQAQAVLAEMGRWQYHRREIYLKGLPLLKEKEEI
jgi:hypothetical protein